MPAAQRKAYILILVGVIVPLALLPFLSGYHTGSGWFSNLMQLKISVTAAFAIPYRFILAVAIFLIFIGVRLLDFRRPEK